jgi:hypothetical protein
MTNAEVQQLLDDGFMLLEPHYTMTRVRHPDGHGLILKATKWSIRAMYQKRRRFYVYEKGFKNPEARDKRLTYLLTLEKRLLHNYQGR